MSFKGKRRNRHARHGRPYDKGETIIKAELIDLTNELNQVMLERDRYHVAWLAEKDATNYYRQLWNIGKRRYTIWRNVAIFLAVASVLLLCAVLRP